MKIQEIQQDLSRTVKREQERSRHKDWSWFTLPQGLRPIPYSTVNLLLAKIHCSPQKTILSKLQPVQNPLYKHNYQPR